jgi:hypothetical protein
MTMKSETKPHGATAAVVAMTAFLMAGGASAVTPDGQQFHRELTRVSAASPFLADCNGPDFPITAAYVNAESEPYVAVNPRHPENFIVVYHEDRFPNDGANGVLAATSFDGGRSWQVPALGAQPKFSRCAGGDRANGGDFEKASDPWVAFGADGTAYFAAVSWNASNPEVAQLVATSADGGRTWANPVTVVRSRDPDVSDASRPVVTTDPRRPHTAYLVWARQRSAPATAVRGDVVFSHTTDSGKTWSKARSIYQTPVGMQTSANQIVVLPNGELLNVFNELRADSGSKHPRHDRIALMRSTDGGVNWSKPSTLATSEVNAVVDPRVGTLVRTGDSFTGVAVDPRAGSNTLYAAWSDARFTQGKTQQVVLASSSDGGRSWSKPAAVSPAAGQQQFIPGIAVNDHGEVALGWYAFATDQSSAPGLLTRYWLSWSADQGRTWAPPAAVTAAAFDFRAIPFNAGFFVGEYQGLAATGRSFVAAMTLANGHEQDNRTDIYACVLTPGTPGVGGTACTAAAASRTNSN